jgi:hypothetical protein
MIEREDATDAERVEAQARMIAALADNAEDAKTKFRNWFLWRRSELAQAVAIDREAEFLDSRAKAICSRVAAVDSVYRDALWAIEGHKIKLDLGGISVYESKGKLIITDEAQIPDDAEFWKPQPPKPVAEAIRAGLADGRVPPGAARAETMLVLRFPKEPKS